MMRIHHLLFYIILSVCCLAAKAQQHTDSVRTYSAKEQFNESKSESRNIFKKFDYTFAVKTNMLYDAALIPNLGVEFPVCKEISIGANWMYAWWSKHSKNRHWRIYGGDGNIRYHFGAQEGKPMTGHHIGAYCQVLVFQIAFGGKGYITGIPGQDIWGKPYWGGGVEYGYTMPIHKRLNIDFTLGLGYVEGQYREYRMIDNHYVWQSSRKRNWWGPTKAEITLEWLIGKIPGKEAAK